MKKFLKILILVGGLVPIGLKTYADPFGPPTGAPITNNPNLQPGTFHVSSATIDQLNTSTVTFNAAATFPFGATFAAPVAIYNSNGTTSYFNDGGSFTDVNGLTDNPNGGVPGYLGGSPLAFQQLPVYRDGVSNLVIPSKPFFATTWAINTIVGDTIAGNCDGCTGNAIFSNNAFAGLTEGTFNAGHGVLMANDSPFADQSWSGGVGPGISFGTNGFPTNRWAFGPWAIVSIDTLTVAGSVYGTTNQMLANYTTHATVDWFSRWSFGRTDSTITSGIEVANEGGQGVSQLKADLGALMYAAGDFRLDGKMSFGSNNYGLDGQLVASHGSGSGPQFIQIFNSSYSAVSAATTTTASSFGTTSLSNIQNNTTLTARITTVSSTTAVDIWVNAVGFSSGSVNNTCEVSLKKLVVGNTILSAQRYSAVQCETSTGTIGNLSFHHRDVVGAGNSVTATYTVVFRAIGTNAACTISPSGEEASIYVQAYPY